MAPARMRYLTGLVASAAVLAVSAAAPAYAARSWAPPVQVNAPGTQVGYTFGAALARGSSDSVFVWSQMENGSLPSLDATVVGPSGVTSPPQQLGTNAYWPAIASDSSGRVYVAWEYESDDGSPDQIMLATRAPGGTFGPPVVVGEGRGGVAVAANANGDVAVMWTRYSSSGRDLIAAVRPAGGSFSAPQDVSGTVGSPVNSGALATAITPGGKGVFVWSADGLVQAVTRSAAGDYGSVQTLSTPGSTAWGARVAGDAAGNVLVMWAEGPNGAGAVRAASLAGGASTFGASVTIGSSAGDYEGIQLGAADNGAVVAVWPQYYAYDANSGYTRAMQYTAGTTTGGFSAPADVNGPNEFGNQLSLAVNPDGSAVLAFIEFGTAELHVYRRDPGGSFQTGGGPLFCPTASVTPVALGTGSDGNAYVGWLRNDQSYPDIDLFAQHDIAASSEAAANCPMPPPAYTVTPPSAHPGETVTIDGSGAPPRNATAATWAWDLDDDGTFEIPDNPNPAVQTSFTTTGRHIVQMRSSWTDVRGDKGSATYNIYVWITAAGNLPPASQPPGSGTAGTTRAALTLSAPAATSLRRALRRGVPATVGAATAARVELRIKSTRLTLGRLTLTARPGTSKVHVRFSKAARRRLSSKKRLRIRVELRSQGRRVASQAVRLH